MAVALPSIPLPLPASDERDRAYGHGRTASVRASSCCRTHCVPRRCRDETGGPPEARLQLTLHGAPRYLRAFAHVWHAWEHAQAYHRYSLAARHAQSRRRSTVRRGRQCCAHALGHQPQTTLLLLELCEKRCRAQQRSQPETAGAPRAALRQAAPVYDALPDLPDNYEREQPLLRVFPVFLVP